MGILVAHRHANRLTEVAEGVVVVLVVALIQVPVLNRTRNHLRAGHGGEFSVWTAMWVVGRWMGGWVGG